MKTRKAQGNRRQTNGKMRVTYVDARTLKPSDENSMHYRDQHPNRVQGTAKRWWWNYDLSCQRPADSRTVEQTPAASPGECERRRSHFYCRSRCRAKITPTIGYPTRASSSTIDGISVVGTISLQKCCDALCSPWLNESSPARACRMSGGR